MRLAELAGFPTTHVRTGSVKDSILAAPRGGDLSLNSSRFFRLTGSQVPACLEGLRRFVRDKGSPLGLRFGAAASVRAVNGTVIDTDASGISACSHALTRDVGAVGF